MIDLETKKEHTDWRLFSSDAYTRLRLVVVWLRSVHGVTRVEVWYGREGPRQKLVAACEGGWELCVGYSRGFVESRQWQVSKS